MSSFPPNPVDGTIIEIKPGEFYIFSSSTQSWTRIDGYKFGLATSNTPGLMSSEDLYKLNSLILPPPSSSLTGESCDIVFKNGTVSLYSTDDSLSIKHDLSVSNPSLGSDETLPWQIHQNTAGYDFKLNLDKLVKEIEARGKLSKIQISGPDGPKGPVGDRGIDFLDTGPKGESGATGSNSPFDGNLIAETLSVEQLEDNKNRAIVSIENETTDQGNFLVITRANIGDPDASPDRVTPKDFESPWVLILDKQEGKITRKIVSNNEDCLLSCKISVSSIYYLNIDGIIDALKERYEYKLSELKANKELLIKTWLRVMSVIYNEQKYALCCALENCETRKRNTTDRRWIESQRIQAATGNMELNISTDKEDRVVSEKSKECETEQTDISNSDRVIYGKECDDFLVKIKLDARIHNKSPRANSKFGYLTAKLPAGDYYVEILDCCANFATQQQNTLPPRLAAYSSKNINGQNVGSGQFINPGGRFTGIRPPVDTGPTPPWRKDACNVVRTNKVGTKPGDSFGILKVSKIGKINGNGGEFPVDDYLVLGYVGSDCRVIYDPKYNFPKGDTTTGINYNDPNYARYIRYSQEVINLVEGYRSAYYRKTSPVTLGYGANVSRITPEIINKNSGQKETTPPAWIAEDGVYAEYLLDPNAQNPRESERYTQNQVRQVLGGAFPRIPAAGEKMPDCVAQDCADTSISGIPNKGKWGGKVAILRKRPSLNFKLKENENAGTELTANQFESYEDFSELVETEVYTSDFGYFDELNEAKNSYVGSNTLFSHAGGTIKVWVPNPDPNVNSSDGEITIGIRSKRCVDQITAATNGTEITTAPIQSIYVYRNKISNDNIIGIIKPYILENETHSNNYKLESGSLVAGPELEADTSKIFFVLASDGLGFYHVHNAKNGELRTSILSTYAIEKNDATTTQVAAGGPATLVPDQFADIYKASWSINNDSKGIVLSELVGDDWTLTLDEMNLGSINKLLAHDKDGLVHTLAQGNLSTQVEEAKNFNPCRTLFRSCNVPESVGGKYSLGIINRSRESFRICRILPEWRVPNLAENPDPPSSDNVWIRKPVTYAGQGQPCGASVCDVSYQVIAGTDGQVVPIPEVEPLRVAPNPTSEGTSPFIDDLLNGRSLDFLLLVHSNISIKSKVDKLAKNLRMITNHFALRGVSDIRIAVARFGNASRINYDISSILTDQPFKRFRLGFLQTPRYLEDYDFYEYGKGKYLPIDGIQPNVGENFYTLTGYVYDNTSISPKPIYGALVHLRLPSLGNKIIQSSVTDENGMYSFKIYGNWPYEIKYDQFGNVISNAEIIVNLYNAPNMNGNWTFDQYSKNASYRQYLQINGSWRTNHETQIPYTEDGNSIISLIPISQPDRNSAQQFVSAGMIFKDIKVESIGGQNSISFKVAIDDDASDKDFDDFQSRVYQKIEECPDQITSQLDPIVSKTYKVAVGIKNPNSNFGYEFGEIQAGPTITIDKSDAEDIINQITCNLSSISVQTEEMPDFEILQDFTYDVDSASYALETINYESDEAESRGFSAIKWASEKMPWFSNAVKMITIITDVESTTEKLNVSIIQDQTGQTDITVPVTVDFKPVADVSNFINNILNPGATPTEELIFPNNWQNNDSSTLNLFSSIAEEDDLYIKTSQLQESAYGYITRLSTNIERSNLALVNSQLDYTTIRFETKIRFINPSEDVSTLIIRIFNNLPSLSEEINPMTTGIISLSKLLGGGSSLSRQNNPSNFTMWASERSETISSSESADYITNQILINQTSSLITNPDDILLGSGSPEMLDLESGNWQTIGAYLIVKKEELLNNPFYVQIAAIGTDSTDTNTSIDGRFEISHIKISFEDEVLPEPPEPTTVTSEDALFALNSKKIILNGIVPVKDKEISYEYAEIECSSHKYQYAECEYVPLTREKIVITEAVLVRQLSVSSISFVAGNKPSNQRGGRKRGPDGRYCNGKSCGEFGIATQQDGSTKLWVDHGARGVFRIKYYRLSPQNQGVLQKPSTVANFISSYGIPNDREYPLRYIQATGARLSPFGTGLAYSTGGALFEISDIDNSSNYYSIPEWQEATSNNPSSFVLQSDIIEDSFGSRKWRLSYDTRNLPSSGVPSLETRAVYLVGKYKNQRIKSVTVVQNEYPNSQFPEVEDITPYSMRGETLIGNNSDIRFGSLDDSLEYTRAISIKRGYKGVLEYQLTPDVYSPLNNYKSEPSIDLVQTSEEFPNNARTTVYQPFWRFSIGVDASSNGLFSQNDISVSGFNIGEAAIENGFHVIRGQLFDGSVINRTPASGIGGNGPAYVYGALVNLTIPSVSQQYVCSAITDISGRFMIKVPIEWLQTTTTGPGQTSSFRSAIEATISIPLYSQQTNDEWQIEPSILADQNSIVNANRLYGNLPSHYQLTTSGNQSAAWRRIIQINDSRFTRESVDSYMTDERIKSVTIQSFFTDPRNYQPDSELVLNQNLLYSSSFMKVENIEFNRQTSRFQFKIKCDDGGFGTIAKNNREKGDLLFNDSFVVVSHPKISCIGTISGRVEPYITITRTVNITTDSNITEAGAINIPAEDDLSSGTMKCGAFFQKFAIEKYREFLTRVPRKDPRLDDCATTVRGGRAARYIRVQGIPLTQEVYDGSVISVVATMNSLPGSLIKSIIYDNQGRGIVMRGVEAPPSSIWQTMNWSVSDVDTYINPLAYTTEGVQALIDIGYSPDDPRLKDTESRAYLLTSELSIKLKDLFAIAFEWVNPDIGIVSFINDVRVGVRYTRNGIVGTTYVDISNFEAYGKNVTDPGEIPLAVFTPQVTNAIPGTPGSYAETILYLNASSSDGDTDYGRKIIEGTSIQIGQLYSKVYFKNEITPYSETAQDRLELAISLSYGPNPTPPTAVVKIGATDADTLKNLEKLINNSGTNGIEYYDPYIQSAGYSQFSSSSDGSSGNIQAYPSTPNSLKIRSRTIGAQGNAFAAHINTEDVDPLTGNPAGPILGAAFGQFFNGNWVSSNKLIVVNNSIIQQGYMTSMNGGVDEVQASDQVTILPSEEDESDYLENWWTITKADNYEQPCIRWKEYCPAAEIVGDNCQRIEVQSNMAVISDLRIPLSKYILTPRCPLDGCEMHHKQVEWYERGWRIGACCGALVEIDGVKWIVVKRSIGIDISCGGGESEENPCIKEAIEAGLGHPAIAWPTVNGEEFIGRPTSGFARFVKDEELTSRIIGALSTGAAIEYRGNMTFADVNDKIPFILFPKA